MTAGTVPAAARLVGRAAERAAVLAALGDARLVSLTGPGGVGKTRLARGVAPEVAAGLPFGCAVVELVPVGQAYLTQAVATALEVTERPGQPLDQAVQERLSQGGSLLVVDGCDAQEPEAVAGLLGRLLDGCPELVVLTTGREPLGIAGERVIPVPPLDPAGDGAALFRERARGPARDADPRLVGEVCTRLGGVPLAIELVAAGGGDLERVGDGGVPAALDWGHAQLDDDERRLLRRLGVFVRGFDRAAAGQVGIVADPGDLIDRLTARRLLVPDGDDRWRLPGPVGAYARDRLAEAGEAAACRARYRQWAAETAAELADRLDTDQPWRSQFELVADDLRAALDGAPEPGDAPHRLARALARLCYGRQFLLEARHHFGQAAVRALDDATAAADLRAGADVSMAEHRGEPAFAMLQESARRADSVDDPAGQAVALAAAVCVGSRFPATFTDEVPHEVLCELLGAARRVAPAGDPTVAAYLAAADAWNATGRKTIPDAALARTALAAARAADDPVLIIAALDAVTSGAGGAGRFREAQELSAERLRQFDRLRRSDPRAGIEIIDTLHVTPLVAVAAGELTAAVAAAGRAWDDPFSGLYMRASKQVVPLMLCGRFDEALRFAATMWDGWQGAGRPAARWMAPAVHSAALIHAFRGQSEAYREWLRRADEMAAPRGQGHISDSFAAYADPRAALHAGDLERAVGAVVDLSCTPPWAQAAHQFYDAYAWAVAAEVAVVAALPDAADRLAVAAPAGAENPWAAACLARAHGRRSADRDALRESVAGWERIGARFERACTLLLLPDRAADGYAELVALGCVPGIATPVDDPDTIIAFRKGP